MQGFPLQEWSLPMNNLTKTDKKKHLEQEANITLTSTSVAIISFFVLLYAQSIVKTHYLKSETFLTIVTLVYAALTVAVGAYAIVKKEKWLWEYAIFGLVMTVGYYFLLNPGVTGLPFLYKETESGLKISNSALKLANLLKTTHIIYGLWAANVLYCILAIALHSVKYNKIKNIKVSKEQ